jgi:hypothetical protein
MATIQMYAFVIMTAFVDESRPRIERDVNVVRLLS